MLNITIRSSIYYIGTLCNHAENTIFTKGGTLKIINNGLMGYADRYTLIKYVLMDNRVYVGRLLEKDAYMRREEGF